MVNLIVGSILITAFVFCFIKMNNLENERK